MLDWHTASPPKKRPLSQNPKILLADSQPKLMLKVEKKHTKLIWFSTNLQPYLSAGYQQVMPLLAADQIE